MARRLALAALAAAALLILVLSGLGGGRAAVGFALLATAFPFLLMALGALRRGRLGRAALPIALLLVLLELSLIGMLVLRGQVQDWPWLVWLPLASGLQLWGFFLLPLLVTALGFAWAFRGFGVAEKDLERLRELGRERTG